MPKKRSPVLEKVRGLMKISLPMAKLMKPISLNLIFSKKNSFKFLTHYNYGYLRGHQFSPCNTPLIFHHRKQKLKEKKFRNLYSMLLMCWCLGKFGDHEAIEGGYSIETLPLPPAGEDGNISSREEEEEGGGAEMPDSDDEEAGFFSVDEMADRFIENFYQQIRMQREESRLQFGELADM